MYITAPAIAINVTGTAGIDAGQGKSILNRFDRIPEGATVFTMAKSYVQIRLASGSQLRLGPETTVKLTSLEHATPRAKRKEGVKLMVGRLWARVTTLFGNDSKFEVETDNAVAGVRGTYILANATEGQSSFYSINGPVDVTGVDGATIRIDSGLGVASLAGALGAPYALGLAEVQTLLAQTTGPAGAIEVQVLGMETTLPGITVGPTELRNVIIGPDQVVDTQLHGDQTGTAAAPTTVDVRVQLQLPTRQ
jgi:hypothetical protein